MKINQSNKNVDFYMSLYERENPGKLRAKRSSNVLLIICMLVFGGFMIVYALRMTANMTLEQSIQENIDYSTNQANIEKYKAQQALQAKIVEIREYYAASETYLQQLSQSERFSREWIDFFDNEMQAAVGSDGEITSYSYSENQVKLSCSVSGPDQPKLYAEHLTKLTDETGIPRFSNVQYTGFSESGGNYEFDLTIVLWTVPEITPVQTPTLSSGE